jgi:hypothetical protein
MKKVLIVGGGLAGLISGRALARAGFDVTVFESTDRVGGKAGADVMGGIVREHGYHIFPAWYRNVRAILTELGIPLIDFDRWHYVKPGGLANPITMRVPNSIPTLIQALTKGLLPWPDTILYGFFVLDMLGEPLSNKATLDQVSRVGMMRGRWYMTDKIPEMESENVLKASAIPVFDLSAMTAKIISAYWVKAPMPFLSILKGDLQSRYIDPIQASAVAAGVKIKLNHKVVDLKVTGSRISEVVTGHGGTLQHHVADEVIVTTPLEVSRKLMNADLHRLDPDLGDFEHLEAAPMASLHVDLNKVLPDVPKEHVFLLGGKYGLSFIDLAQNWGLPNTTLSCISSNFTVLQDLPEADQQAELFGELAHYLGITMADVANIAIKPNTDVPLFINTVGAWGSRPGPKAAKVDNLFFAGDWVRNAVDLACMEGAVSAALSAAHAIGHKHGQHIEGPHKAPTYPTDLVRALKWLLTPAMVPVWLAAKIWG